MAATDGQTPPHPAQEAEHRDLGRLLLLRGRWQMTVCVCVCYLPQPLCNPGNTHLNTSLHLMLGFNLGPVSHRLLEGICDMQQFQEQEKRNCVS